MKTMLGSGQLARSLCHSYRQSVLFTQLSVQLCALASIKRVAFCCDAYKQVVHTFVKCDISLFSVFFICVYDSGIARLTYTHFYLNRHYANHFCSRAHTLSISISICASIFNEIERFHEFCFETGRWSQLHC